MPHADDAVGRAVRSFAAEMLAEIAHELNNRLATMRETVGLLEDLARAGKAGAAGTARAHASLDDQVGRALNIVHLIGGLGSALEGGAGTFDAGAAVARLLGMSERWARRQSLRIEREIGAGTPAAAGDPAVFLCLLHRLLARCAGALPEGGVVHVRVAHERDGVAVRVTPAGGRTGNGAAPAAGEEETDRRLAERLDGELSFAEGGAATVRLRAAG